MTQKPIAHFLYRFVLPAQVSLERASLAIDEKWPAVVADISRRAGEYLWDVDGGYPTDTFGVDGATLIAFSEPLLVWAEARFVDGDGRVFIPRHWSREFAGVVAQRDCEAWIRVVFFIGNEARGLAKGARTERVAEQVRALRLRAVEDFAAQWPNLPKAP